MPRWNLKNQNIPDGLILGYFEGIEFTEPYKFEYMSISNPTYLGSTASTNRFIFFSFRSSLSIACILPKPRIWMIEGGILGGIEDFHMLLPTVLYRRSHDVFNFFDTIPYLYFRETEVRS